MSASEWMVIAGGVAAIAWVNWYLFLAERSAVSVMAGPNAAGAGDGSGAATVPQVTITVKGGYDPAVIRVSAGRPVRLVFDRQETSSCSEEIVFPDFGIRRFLPAHQQTVIEVTPPAAGRYEFTCGMSMLRGSLIAE